MAVFGNFKGTTQSDFKIGKTGAKIHGGNSEPSANLVSGDIWIDSGNLSISVYQGNSFSSIGSTLAELNVDDGTLFVDSANDTVSIGSTASNEKLFVNGSLRLGTNPAIKYSGAFLDVSHSNGTETVLRVRDNDTGTDPVFKIYSANNESEVFKVEGTSVTVANVYILPTADGANGQVITTDGTGNLSFTTISATPAGNNTQIQFNDDGSFGATSALTFDETNHTIQTGIFKGVLFQHIDDYGSISESTDIAVDYGLVDTTSKHNTNFGHIVETEISATAVDLSAIDQDIIPAETETIDLGSATKRFRDLYLSGNTINLGTATISAEGETVSLPVGTTVGNVTIGTIKILGSRADAEELPASNNEPGDAFVVTDPAPAHLYTWDGDQWVDLGGFQGPKGDKGDTGDTGDAATATPVGAPRITNIVVTGNTYSPTGATAVALEGGFVQITGNGFQSGCQAIIGSNNATATGFNSSETLDVEVPAQSAGSYIVYVVNPDGGVALRPNGITYSGLPTWVTDSTLPSQTANAAISIQLEATSDSAVTYALAAGSSLPANVSISSAGLISGTASVQEITVFSFTVIATDAESQSSPRTFDLEVNPLTEVDVEYLVVAGGGGGGFLYGGGGGAGGYRTATLTNLNLNTNFTVTVGGGGAGGTEASVNGSQGSSSVFESATSAGGGGGAHAAGAATTGGSGGGGAGLGVQFGGTLTGAAGNTPSTSPSQGNKGGDGAGLAQGVRGAGGGGGAGAVGGNGTTLVGGTGGNGAASSITGTSITRAGGGGGGVFSGTATTYAGGTGGGGASASGDGTVLATPGTVNTGGGGGGGSQQSASPNPGYAGAAGGSGVVILKYPSTRTISNPGGGLTFSTSTAVSGFKVTTFTAGTGNVQWS